MGKLFVSESVILHGPPSPGSGQPLDNAFQLPVPSKSPTPPVSSGHWRHLPGREIIACDSASEATVGFVQLPEDGFLLKLHILVWRLLEYSVEGIVHEWSGIDCNNADTAFLVLVCWVFVLVWTGVCEGSSVARVRGKLLCPCN